MLSITTLLSGNFKVLDITMNQKKGTFKDNALNCKKRVARHIQDKGTMYLSITMEILVKSMFASIKMIEYIQYHLYQRDLMMRDF